MFAYFQYLIIVCLGSQENWLQQATEDPDLKKEPETLKGEDKEEIEEINIEDGDDKDDGDETEEVEVELDFNDPTILRLLRVNIKVYLHVAIAQFSFYVLHGLNSFIEIKCLIVSDVVFHNFNL